MLDITMSAETKTYFGISSGRREEVGTPIIALRDYLCFRKLFYGHFPRQMFQYFHQA
jgi:hypothetical protein